MPTILDRFNRKRESLKTIEQLRKFVLDELTGFAFSITFPNGDARMGVGHTIIWINAPSQYVSIKPVYQVGTSEEDAVTKTVKALPRILSQVRDQMDLEEATRMEGIVYGSSATRTLNRSNRQPTRGAPPAPKLEDAFPKRAKRGAAKKAPAKSRNRNTSQPRKRASGMTAAQAEGHRVH